MRFTTGGGFGEAAIKFQTLSNKEKRNHEVQPSTDSFRLTNARPGGRKARKELLLASLTLSRARNQHRCRNLFATLTGFPFFFQGRDAGLRKTFNSIDTDRKGHITQKDLEAYALRTGLPSSYAAHFASAVRATASSKVVDPHYQQQQPSSSTCSCCCSTSSTSPFSPQSAADGLSSPGSGASASPNSPQRQQQQQLRPPAIAAAVAAAAAQRRQQSSDEPEDAELTFTMFRCFVRSREEALRRAFDLFDQDGDGRISVADLDASLSRVAVCCPQTRCIYRCPSRMARQLHSTATPEHGSLGFSEFRDFFLLLPQQDMLVEYWVTAGSTPDLLDKLSMCRTAGEGPPGAKASPWGHLLAGAVAGATSRTATAPLETLRLAAMAGQLQSRSLAQAASDIVSSQGWRGLYRGNMLNVMRSAPQKALDFFAFDALKRLLGEETHLQTFLAAGLAGCTSWIALYPLEVVRSRVTVSAAAASMAASASTTCALTAAVTAGGPSGLLNALSTIVRTEGPGALYRGLGPSVAAIFPEAAITYGLHDSLKKAYTRVTHREPGVAPSLAFGVLSAFTGQLVSFPLETVSRRLQVGGAAAAGAGGGGLAGAAAVLRELLAQGGPAALYRGIGAATLRLVPMACVSFGTYEAVRAMIVSWEQQQEDQQVKQMLISRCVPLVLEGRNGGQEVVGRWCTASSSQTPTLCECCEPSDTSTPALELTKCPPQPLTSGTAVDDPERCRFAPRLGQ